MIHMQGLKKSFSLGGRKLPILDVPLWEVAQGSRLAVLGPSGSGKSTLLHLLSGILKPDEGSVIVAGEALERYTEGARDAFRAKQIGYIFQDFHLIPSLTAEQNVELVLPPTMGKAQKRALVREWLAKVGMDERGGHLPSQLSRGQQQRVAIVRALINRPPLILADEPTGSLDYETAGQIMELLLGLCERESSTLIAVTHDLHLAQLFGQTAHIGDINALTVRKPDSSAAARDAESASTEVRVG